MSDVARLLSPSYCSGDVVARYTVYAVQVQEYFGHSGIGIGTVVAGVLSRCTTSLPVALLRSTWARECWCAAPTRAAAATLR